ncbi:MAG TPA: dUTP diphosphatase [Blastocatellia bacterium]|nr:dUTP diphosphatase [Blastocatellia bacterium]
MIELKIKMLDPDLTTPSYQHPGDAGLDLPSRIDLVLGPGERAMVPTGVAVAIPEGYCGFVLIRSGLAARHGIACVNSPGLIDSGYRGELTVIALNTDRREPFRIKRGERIAQLVIQRVEQVMAFQVEQLDDTSRGDGGFGSTGK